MEVSMDAELFQRVQWCFDQRRYGDALQLLELFVSRAREPHWNVLYLAGQANRFLGRLDEAQQYLRKSLAAPGGRQAEVLHALGIVLQKQEKLAEAIIVFKETLELQKDHDPALNSLALTYKMMGQLHDAHLTYERAVTAYFRRLAMSLENAEDNELLLHEETEGDLWRRKTLEMAMFLAAVTEGIDEVLFPTGEQAIEEANRPRYRGKLYLRIRTASGKDGLYFLPNFFNTMRERLKESLTYAVLLNNLGTVFAAMGRLADARTCFKEAIEFTPEGARYDAPRDGLAALGR
jgi:tetratricopeptide (TPR) repeat protein